VFGGGSSLPLARIFGFRVGVHPSWFLILFLWIFWLRDSFERAIISPDQGFIAAVISAALFFGSIVAHELGHALAARREGISVEGIDLFLFGGVMKMSRDTDSPGAEFRVAVAGPLVTFLLIVLSTAAAVLLAGADSFWDAARLSATADATPAEVVVSLLVSMNLLLLVFNLVPAFPLDGGRIARAIAWRLSGNKARATRISARMGQAFAVLMAGYGLYRLADGDTWGLWYVMLAWLLGSSARTAILQSDFSDRLDGITVADLMDAEPVTIPAATPAERAYEDFFLRYQGWDWFAVVDADGRLVGIAHREPLRQVYEAGDHRPVGELVVPPGEDGQVRSDTPLEVLLSSEPLRRFGALMAVDGEGRLRGVVTLDQVSRALQAQAGGA